MKGCLSKYFKSSIILHQSTIGLTKVEVPDIYICNHGSYNLSKSTDSGFKYQTYFLAGIKEGFNTATWNEEDSDFGVLLNTLYGVNENNFGSLSVQTPLDDEES